MNIYWIQLQLRSLQNASQNSLEESRETLLTTTSISMQIRCTVYRKQAFIFTNKLRDNLGMLLFMQYVLENREAHPKH
jgi:hypothetical protein